MKSSAEPFLKVEELTCGYPARTVLSDLEFSLHAGHVAILLGPNGSGKSTLLKTLAQSIPALNGRSSIDGRELASMSASELARLVAYVPQEEVPPFRFTVRQIVLMGRLPLSTGFFDTAADHAAAEAAMEQADCLALADRPISEISGGERQRALIARALAQEAPLLLLDEPTSHLDIGHQVAIVDLIRRLCREGRTVLAAMHDLNLAAEIGDRSMLLAEGRVALDGPTDDVLASPLLDQTYGVPFDRFTDPTGRMRVFARIESKAF